MAEYQPLSIPSNYYDTPTTTTVATTTAPSSFELMDNNNNNNNRDSRKRKQRVSTTEPYFTNYHWEAGPPNSSSTPHEHDNNNINDNNSNNNNNNNDKDWSSTTTPSHFNDSNHQQHAFVFDDFQQGTPSFFNGYQQQPYSSQSSGQNQPPYQQPYSHQSKNHQKVTDPIQSLLQSQELDHRSFQPTWDSSLPSNQSSSTTTTDTSYRPNSAPINHTTFSPDGLFAALSDERSTNNLMKFDPSITSDKSPHSLSSPGNDGNMMLLASQHYPSNGIGGTPPSSPATMTSTHSSPAITPMYGRLSNLSLRQHQPKVTSMNHLYQQQQQQQQQQQNPSLPFTKHNGANDVDIMMTINERPIYNSYNPSQHSPNDFVLDYHTTTATTNLISPPPRNLHSVTTARNIQQQVTAAKMQPIIHQYLGSKDPIAMGEKTVVIMSSKVAQKSYGTEKRFLCPPPTAILVGSTWWSLKKKNKNKNAQDNPDDEEVFQQGHGDTLTRVTPPKIMVCISGESSSQAGQIEWYSQATTMVVGQTGFPRQPTLPDPGGNNNTRFKSHSSTETRNNGGDWYHNPRVDPVGGGRCVSKQLFINDADEKRKRVECLVKIQIQDQWMGTLAGKGIKVISKPSKKRQSVKNMELCIHHGSVVSLFNRIRSQTVSTKYLGVSNGTDSPFAYPGQPQTEQTKTNDGTCFVARTTCWDPFVIWLVDTSQQPPPEQPNSSFPSHAEDYIGHRAFKPSVNYPPPPAIALRNTTQQPLAIHYNQHVVLQCLTTGLVSPVMIIRKVDKASTVVGGARSVDEPLLTNGGEYGDELLGDPVSQLHKIALQIVHDPSQLNRQQQQQTYPIDMTTGLMENMLPRYNSPVTYLACLNDMVGMHRSTEQRQPILKTPPPPPPHQPAAFMQEEIIEEGGRVVRKRKVSAYGNQPQPLLGIPDIYDVNNGFYGDPSPPPPAAAAAAAATSLPRRRVNSYDEYGFEQQQLQGSTSTSILTGAHENWANLRTRSLSTQDHRPPPHRRVSSSSSSTSSTATSWMNGPLGGAYWYEDVSDAAVWTLVGTDIASYTFLAPPPDTDTDPTCDTRPPSIFPHLSHYTLLQDDILHLHGDNLARDLQIWLGDIRAPHVEYKSRELVICRLPSRQQLLECAFIESYHTTSPSTSSSPSKKIHYQLPFLLVKAADGIVHKSSIFYQF